MVCIWGGNTRCFVFIVTESNVKYFVSIQSQILISYVIVCWLDSSLNLVRALLSIDF